jgi:hypothetical protein
VRGGKQRTLEEMDDHHDSPTLAWSPNGRLLALHTEGRSPSDYTYAIIDVAARPTDPRMQRRPMQVGGFRLGPQRQERLRSPRRRHRPRAAQRPSCATLIKSRATYTRPLVAFAAHLLYEESVENSRTYEVVSDTVSLLDLRTGHKMQLASSRRGFVQILPLART